MRWRRGTKLVVVPVTCSGSHSSLCGIFVLRARRLVSSGTVLDLLSGESHLGLNVEESTGFQFNWPLWTLEYEQEMLLDFAQY